MGPLFVRTHTHMTSPFNFFSLTLVVFRLSENPSPPGPPSKERGFKAPVLFMDLCFVIALVYRLGFFSDRKHGNDFMC